MKKYQIIVVDPPWQQGRGGKKAVVKNTARPFDYNLLSLGAIQDILNKVGFLADENRILFLWTIDKYLFQAEDMAKKVGYKLHARMIWNKVRGMPTAFTIRFGHEYLLYMYHGKLLPVAKEERGKIHSVFTEQNRKHSQKPEISYRIIERLYPNAHRLELFARQKRNGWDCIGNEIDGLDIAESIKLL